MKPEKFQRKIRKWQAVPHLYMGVVLPYPSFVFSGFLRTSWLERGTQFHTLFVSIIINCFIGDWEQQKQIKTMKKYFLLLLVALLIPRNIFAYDFEVDGIYYDVISLTDFTCKVSRNNDDEYEGSIIIPATVNYSNRTLMVTEIGDYAFSYSDLTSITMPNTITKIGKSAFRGCRDLKQDVTIPNSVTEISEGAFASCQQLKRVFLSNALTKIETYTFQNCKLLENITIPNSVTEISHYAFDNCTNFTNIMIPNSVITIGVNAFRGCISLDNVTIPNSVKTIAREAFQNCSNLKSVTLGIAIQTIDSNVFNGCNALESLYILNTTPPSIQSTSFTTDHYMNLNVFVPKGTLETYQNAVGWNQFWHIQENMEETPEMEKCATPTIQYASGKLTFTCATPDAVCYSEITDTDIRLYSGNEIQLGVTYNISVYAKKVDYEDSDMATATLCWIDAAPQTDGISNGVAEVKALPVMIQSANGTVLVNGLDDDTQVSVYSVNGMHVGSAISNGGQASISTNMESGSIAIVKMGDKSVKVLMK